LITLCEELNNGTYQIGRSIAFIVNKPVKREIFAADFRDISGEPAFERTRIKIESGDELEFDAEEDDRYGKKAVRIFYDGRKPLDRFAVLPNWESKIALLVKFTVTNK